MLYEHRTYRVAPGKLPQFMDIYNAHVYPVISKYAKLSGGWATESGTLNSAVFVWAYNDFAHRAEQRAKLAADPDWGPNVGKIVPLLVHQESFFMNPAPFMTED